MLTHLQAWLNGSQDYSVGVALYCQLGDDKALADIFTSRKSSYLANRLYNELLAIYEFLKQQNVQAKPTSISLSEKGLQEPVQQLQATDDNPTTAIETNQNQSTQQTVLNPYLYNACLQQAHAAYKECMNLRAVLFNAVPDLHEQINRQDLVIPRGKMALEVLRLSKIYSELYDRADFVKANGRLPVADQPDHSGPVDINIFADSQVKQKLDNARKSISKLKLRPPTPERLQLIQDRQLLIDQLAERWRLLQENQQ